MPRITEARDLVHCEPHAQGLEDEGEQKIRGRVFHRVRSASSGEGALEKSAASEAGATHLFEDPLGKLAKGQQNGKEEDGEKDEEGSKES